MERPRRVDRRFVFPGTADPRWALFAFLASFLVYAVCAPGFLRRPEQILAAMATAVSLDFILGGLYKGDVRFPLSGLITSCGTVLLCDSPFVYPYALVAALAILSKHALRTKSRHVFNPLNLAMTVVLLFLPNLVIVDASRWGGSLLMLVAVALLGVFASWKARRLDLSVAYITTFLVGAFVRSRLTGAPLASTLAPFTGAAFQLFAFFMITDPVTTPATRPGRIAFAVVDGIADAVFRYLKFRNAPFYALFLTCGISPVLPAVFPDEARERVWDQKGWRLPDASLAAIRRVQTAGLACLAVVLGVLGLRATPRLILAIAGPGASVTGWTESGETSLYHSLLGALRQRGRIRPALALARLRTLARPDDAYAWIDRAELALAAGDRADSAAALARAGKADTMGEDELLRAGAVFDGLDDIAATRGLLERAAVARPDDLRLLLERTRLEMRAGDRAAAAALLARARKLPLRDDQRRALALQLQDVGDYKAASGIFDELIRNRPGNASLYSDRAVCKVLSGDDEAAMRDARAAIRLEPELLEPYLTMGYIQTALGKTRDALTIYEHALSLKGADDAALMRRIRQSRDELIAHETGSARSGAGQEPTDP